MNKTHYGVPAVIIASIFFAGLTALNRIIPQNVGTFHQSFIRTSMMGILFLIAGFLHKDLKKIQRKYIPLIALRGLFVIGDFATFFIAVNHLQLGTTLFLFYSSTIIANFLYGSFILHEKMDRVKLASFLLAIVGLGIIYINNIQSLASIFVIFGLFSGFSYGFGV